MVGSANRLTMNDGNLAVRDSVQSPLDSPVNQCRETGANVPQEAKAEAQPDANRDSAHVPLLGPSTDDARERNQ